MTVPMMKAKQEPLGRGEVVSDSALGKRGVAREEGGVTLGSGGETAQGKVAGRICVESKAMPLIENMRGRAMSDPSSVEWTGSWLHAQLLRR